jgi:Mn2+/Fe2+ NRAMP family transporter
MTNEAPAMKGLVSALAGAAFLMATSAVGPGFLTQTTVFTGQLMASFGFAILVSIIIDIFAQLNIWRVITVSGKPGQDIANQTFPGSGYLLASLVAFGGLVFNVGNIAGTGLGFNAATGLPVELGSAISVAIAAFLFMVKDAGRAMDMFVKALGLLLIAMVTYVVFISRPPLVDAIRGTFWPDVIDAKAIVTLVGGTVGGYITFAGAHRLIDAGITGRENLRTVNRGAVSGIMLTGVIRVMLFLAAFGAVSMGLTIGGTNPAASVFEFTAGGLGLRIFGIVMWAAAITSVVGAAFTSVSFIKTLYSKGVEHQKYLVLAFLAVSASVFFTIGQPVKLLIWAGTINGFILPIGLALMLLASRKFTKTGDAHPLWLAVSGWFTVLVMLGFSLAAIVNTLRGV